MKPPRLARPKDSIFPDIRGRTAVPADKPSNKGRQVSQSFLERMGGEVAKEELFGKGKQRRDSSAQRDKSSAMDSSFEAFIQKEEASK